MSYDNWRKRLKINGQYSTVAERRKAIAALGINFSQPGPLDEGYYRKPITVKDESGNGRSRIVDWVPVAYFLADATSSDGAVLCGTIGKGDELRNMTAEEITDEQLWSWVVSHPIPYEIYEAVAENGVPWPDVGMVANERVIERTDNLPPEVDPVAEHGETITNAANAALSNFKEIASEEQIAQAEGAKNRLAELRLQAEKKRKAAVQPHIDEQRRVNGLWMPMIGVAERAEAELKRVILVWREKERRRIATEQAEADQKRRDAEEAADRAADRAIANGTPPSAQEAPVAAPEPAPAAAPEPVRPTYGNRRTKAVEAWHFDGVTDWEKVVEFYKESTEVKALLTQLAHRDVKAGREIPGTNRHWGVI